MFCKSCGMTMDETFTVCALCGTKKGEGNTFCAFCGTIRQYDEERCRECGVSFDDPVPPKTVSFNGSKPSQTKTVPLWEEEPAPAEPSVFPEDSAAAEDVSPAQEEPVVFYSPSGTAVESDTSAAAVEIPDKPEASTLAVKVFCRGCAHELLPGEATCPECGTKRGEGDTFCKFCGAPTRDPQATSCPSCGKSFAESFDLGKYMAKYVQNITGIFKNPGFPGVIFDYGSYFLSILMLIIALLPSVTVAQGAYSYFEYNLISIFAMTGLGGFLVVLAFLFSLARFVPHVDDFINIKNPKIGRFAIFVVPALDLLATVSLFIHMFFGSLNIVTIAEGIETYYSLAFFGWIFVLLTLVNILLSVLSMLRGMGKIRI